MKRKSISARISEARCLQLSNELSEGVATGSVREWRAVAAYWRSEFDMLARYGYGVQISMRIAMSALRDISNLPRGGRHKRIAVAAVRFIEAMREQSGGGK